MKALKDIEWSKYSQNGEDGIIEYLGRSISGYPYFVEIGCGSGKQNNTTWLAEQGWLGSVFDSRKKSIKKYCNRKFPQGINAHCVEVTPENCASTVNTSSEPAVFSIDIDSFDYHVVSALFQLGLRPSVAVLEYNAIFGLDPVTVPYPMPEVIKHFYFGCGVNAWRKLIEPYGYRFVTVDSAGVNAFFVRSDAITAPGIDDVEWLPWADCRWAAERYGPAEERRKKIADKPLVWV